MPNQKPIALLCYWCCGYHQLPRDDFFELDPLNNTIATAVIRTMKRNFARHGIPEEWVTDNGPQFDSHEYFAQEYGFTTMKSSPYYSQGNGKAESAVKIAKNILKKSRHEDHALLAYGNTPQLGYDYSPAQRLMSRRLRDIILTADSQLAPQTASQSVVLRNIAQRRLRSKAQYDQKASVPLREFAQGEKVYVKPGNYRAR